MLTAAAGRDLETAGDMAAVLYWRLPALTPTNPGPLPWLPGIPETLHAHPVWGDYLAKRSQLVADLADQVQDHACQGDAEPVWAPPGSHPSTALIGEIAVWRAANGINPQDPRPTGGSQLETLPALWKQRLDRDIARATYPPADARADERQAGRTALSQTTTGSARTKDPNGVRAGRPRPADSTASVVRSRRSEHEVALHAAMAGQAAHCRIWLFQIKGRASPGQRRVSSLRCGRAVLDLPPASDRVLPSAAMTTCLTSARAQCRGSAKPVLRDAIPSVRGRV